MTTALYRRYRPQTFAEVIGQEHVTEPLQQALRTGRITHAYLFSGPRGCGKTTSARILARCLNCEQGPTDVPCGECDSCIELSRDGTGSMDVVEIDAASHNGVDDARDLRERAAFAPARDRFKIFILDEAHMVTTQGFNALLKIVEEPPPHVKFIFATTEPDKVISTIRSRTHHYPFHLVPPDQLQTYLAQICEEEGVAVASGVLPLVVRAGAGSVRDSLSVLDQLIAGSDEKGIEYEHAVDLLGYTHAALLDDVVEAFAAGDGAAVYRVIDKVIESGHEPRRFVEDLLERLRDLLVISVASDAADAVLRGIPEDQLTRMKSQATRFTSSELSTAADTVDEALTDMTGATSPRLRLELLCARILIARNPGASVPASPVSAVNTQSEPVTPPAPPAATPTRDNVPQAAPSDQQTAPKQPTSQQPAPKEPAPKAQAPKAKVEPAGAMTTESLRRRWPEVLSTLSQIRRVTWGLISQHAQIADLTDQALVLSFPTPALTEKFTSGNGHVEDLTKALEQTLGLTIAIEVVRNGAVKATPSPSSDSLPEQVNDASDDDPDIEGSNLVGQPLVEQLLGGEVVDEIDLEEND